MDEDEEEEEEEEEEVALDELPLVLSVESCCCRCKSS
jgi:hypothetical protein